MDNPIPYCKATVKVSPFKGKQNLDLAPITNEHLQMKEFQKTMNKPTYAVSYMGAQNGQFGIF